MGTLFITGGAGFLGSNLVHYALAHTGDRIVVIDKLTYAGSLLNIDSPLKDPRAVFIHADIADRDAMRQAFSRYAPSAVINLAAETHFDRSIDSPQAFIDTNIVGAFVLLEAARERYQTLSPAERDRFRFVHVSTDEVYGTLGAPVASARRRHTRRTRRTRRRKRRRIIWCARTTTRTRCRR